MIIKVNCTVENVETYTGKNGFGANITISQLNNKKREMLTFSTQSPQVAKVLEEKLQESVILDLELTQNRFGTRIGEVINYEVA